MIHYLIYFLYRALQNFKENRFTTVVTVAVITVSLFLFSCFLIIYNNVSTSLSTWGNDVSVSAYLKDSVSMEEVSSIINKIKSYPEVEAVSYLSKEDAIKHLSVAMKGVSGVVDELGTNPLPASIEITLKEDMKQSILVEAFVQKISQPAFEDIDWSQEWVEKFYIFIDFLKWSGFLLGSLLGVASVFIISQTLRLSYFARKDEFEILELLGATTWFIRIPFILEGFFQGLIGATLSQIMIYIGFNIFEQKFTSTFQYTLGAISLKFLSNTEVWVIICSGMLLGLLGSFFSIRKTIRWENSGNVS